MEQLKKNLKKYWSFYISGTLIGLVILAYFSVPEFNDFLNKFWEIIWSDDRQRITSWFKNFGLWGPVLIIILMILQMFLIVFPTWLPMIVAVIGYGSWLGMLISVVAVFSASTIGYFLGERLADPIKENLVGGKKYRKLSEFMKRHGFWAVVLFRISPFLSNDVISFVAGIIKMGYWKFIYATMVGIIPLAGAIAYFGKDTETLQTGLYWLGGTGLLIYIIYHYFQNRSQ
ncbi:MAG: TVP38/TMEM64 family protein [Saprospiraceae bacterium]|nr:TVP38/TMEM64 family protein [Saprospiraceae bacterium]